MLKCLFIIIMVSCVYSETLIKQFQYQIPKTWETCNKISEDSSGSVDYTPSLKNCNGSRYNSNVHMQTAIFPKEVTATEISKALRNQIPRTSIIIDSLKTGKNIYSYLWIVKLDDSLLVGINHYAIVNNLVIKLNLNVPLTPCPQYNPQKESILMFDSVYQKERNYKGLTVAKTEFGELITEFNKFTETILINKKTILFPRIIFGKIPNTNAEYYEPK